MRSALPSLVISALAGLVLLVVVFVGGMRAKWPPVIDALRSMTRKLGRGQLASSGHAGAFAGVLHHVGRGSGRHYATPLGIEPFGDDFVIAIVYGRRSDWLQNVLAAGGARVELEGRTYQVERPTIVPTAKVSEVFGATDRFCQRLLAIDECLLLHRSATGPTSAWSKAAVDAHDRRDGLRHGADARTTRPA